MRMSATRGGFFGGGLLGLCILAFSLLGGAGLGVYIGSKDYGQDDFDDLWFANEIEKLEGLAPPKKDEPQPKVLIAEESFDMGEVQEGSTTEHRFSVTNGGKGNLELRRGGTTCNKCTMNDLPKDNLAPDERVEVTVSYKALNKGPFRQTAILLTNDRTQPRIPFVITGKVIAPLQASPSSIVFSHLSSAEPETATMQVLVYGPKPLEILGYEFTEPDSAAFFQANIVPLTDQDLASSDARSGVKVTITALAGLPLGAVHQSLMLKTNQEKTPTVNVAIDGQVRGDVSIYGYGWNVERSSLSLGVISHVDGLKREVFIVVRGPHRRESKFRIISRKPDWIGAELGTPFEAQDGAIVKWPLELTIPPGTASANYSGVDTSKVSELLLESGLPDGKQLRMLLNFIIE